MHEPAVDNMGKVAFGLEALHAAKLIRATNQINHHIIWLVSLLKSAVQQTGANVHWEI